MRHLLVVVTLASCTYSRPEDVEPVAATVAIVSGDAQRGEVATTLVIPLAVRAEDAAGELLPNRPVEFAVIAGNGSVSTPATTTSPTGEAQTLLTLGTKAEPHAVTATIDGLTATFEITALPGEPVRIEGTGEDQVGTALLPLDPFVVTIFDTHDNSVPDIRVDFVRTAGEGFLDVTSAMTDAGGRAQVVVTPSNLAEINEVEARALDLDVLTFRATTRGLRDDQFVGNGRLRTIGNIDGDDRPDLVLSDNNRVIFVFSNRTPQGAITTSFEVTRVDLQFSFTSVAVADVDADGRTDLLVNNDDELCILSNTTQPASPLTFAQPACIGSNQSFAIVQLEVADLDGDTRPDLVFMASSDLRFMRNTGEGFAASVTIDTNYGPPLAIADLDGDQTPDLVARRGGRIRVFRNTSVGAAISFATPLELPATTGGEVDLADIDGDDKIDLVTSATSGFGIDVVRNTSASTGVLQFAVPVLVAMNVNTSRALTFGDLNTDGKADLLTGNGTSTVSTLMNQSTGTTLALSPPINWPLPFATDLALVADFNSDGRPDVVVGSGASTSLLLAE